MRGTSEKGVYLERQQGAYGPPPCLDALPTLPVHEIIWEFRPAPDRERDFETTYGPAGPWADLFRRADGYLGTELIPPRAPGGWYRTIDRWDSAAAYERFRQTCRAEYAALDDACESLTLEERPVRAGRSPGEEQ